MAEFSLHLPGILLAYTALALGIFSPGPAVLAIIGTSMAKGRHSGLSLAAGVVTGSVFWGILAAAGVAALFSAYAPALIALKIAGGLYLLWLSYKSIRAARRANGGSSDMPDPVKANSFARLYGTGFLIHLTNPKAIFAWIATITLGMTASSPLWVGIVIVAGGALISVLGNMSYALIFSTERMMKAYRRAGKYIQYTFGGFFAFAGIKMLTTR